MVTLGEEGGKNGHLKVWDGKKTKHRSHKQEKHRQMEGTVLNQKNDISLKKKITQGILCKLWTLVNDELTMAH